MTFIALFLLPSAALVTAAAIEATPFAGFKVFRIGLPDAASAELLDDVARQHGLDIWAGGRVGATADVMVGPLQSGALEELLVARPELPMTELIADVQSLVELERRRPPGVGHKFHKSSQHNMSWDEYHDVDDMHGYLDYLEQTFEHVETESIGKSLEGRDMRIVKICRGGCGNKTAVWLDGGIHAREWISPAVVTYMVRELAEKFAQHDDLVEKLDWYILPSHNPDGYAYTRSSVFNRLWRKTRSHYEGHLCTGTDGNRNWGFHWNEGGASGNNCDQTYHGPEAFSEVETRNVRDFILKHSDKIKFFNSLHSYSQLVLLPYGHTTEHCPGYDKMMAAATKAVDALHAVHGKNYDVGCIPCLLYIASGGSMDWALGVAGIPYSYGMELRDTGLYGFLLPPAQIVPAGEETWAFHKSMARDMIAEFGAATRHIQ